MASKKKAKSSSSPYLGLMAVGIAGLAVLAYYVKNNRNSDLPEPKHVPTVEQSASQQNKPAPEVTVITPSRDGTELKLDKSAIQVPAGTDARLYAINHFLQASKITDAKARAVGIEIRDRMAYVDFSKEFEASYGSLDEEALLKGICASLAQFPDIDKVAFRVEGHTLESIGNVDLSEGIEVRSQKPTS